MITSLNMDACGQISALIQMLFVLLLLSMRNL